MSKTILIVDDSLTMRQTMGFTLREAGFTVLEGNNGKEGLGQLDQAQPNLIITDLNMPVMDGLEFIRQLRARPACKYTPVLMVTTESDDSKKQEIGRAHV